MTRSREREGYAFVWNGAHTVNVFDLEWNTNIDVFSVGSFAEDAATSKEVEEGIQGWLEGGLC